MRADAATMESAVAACSAADLISIRAYLLTQEPHGLIWLGLGMIENEIISRFITAETSHD